MSHLKIAITGANGMLGAALSSVFYGYHEVLAIHRDEESIAPATDSLKIDLVDSGKDLSLHLAKFRPDLLIHSAALVDIGECERNPRLAYQQNVEVTRNIVSACPPETRVIYISSDQVYGENPDRSEEATHLEPLNEYGGTKLEGERLVLQADGKALVIRTNIVGCSSKPNRSNSTEWMLRALENNEEITLFTDYLFSPIYTKFLAPILLALHSRSLTGIFNVGAPASCSKFDYGTCLAAINHLPADRIRPGSIEDLGMTAKRSKDLGLDVKKIGDHDIRLPTVEESIRALSAEWAERKLM